MKLLRWVLPCLALLAGTGCGNSKTSPLLGTLEWDRVSLPAEASEAVQTLPVAEGARVKAGDVLVTLDGRRMAARITQAEAELKLQQDLLSERLNGTRIEEIDAARAALASATASRIEANKQYSRQAELARKQLVPVANADAARATRDRSEADVRSAEAQLRELTTGTRVEQIAQARASVAAAGAALDRLRLDQAHLTVRAPRAGRVDALPFKVGDQPPLGAHVVSLLVGEAPYARVFVPASQRPRVQAGQVFTVRVNGIDRDLRAHLRSVSSEPAFTPYYALTGDDASRLVYRAELEIEDKDARNLPAGLTLEARPAQ